MTITAIPVPSIDQKVQYMSLDAPLAATIVNIWEDGPVDIVVTDPSVPEQIKVNRMVYVPFGGTYVPLNTVNPDPRYVTQIAAGGGVAPAPITSTAPTEGADGQAPGTEPLES